MNDFATTLNFIFSLSEGKKWLFRASCLLGKSFSSPRSSGIFCRQISQNDFSRHEYSFSQTQQAYFLTTRGPKCFAEHGVHQNHRITFYRPRSILGSVKVRKWINSAKGLREPSLSRLRTNRIFSLFRGRKWVPNYRLVYLQQIVFCHVESTSYICGDVNHLKRIFHSGSKIMFRIY
jgi:hypothetical protein